MSLQSTLVTAFSQIMTSAFNISKPLFKVTLAMVAEMLQKKLLCDIKIYFYSIKINLYLIKYFYITSKCVFIQSK